MVGWTVRYKPQGTKKAICIKDVKKKLVSVSMIIFEEEDIVEYLTGTAERDIDLYYDNEDGTWQVYGCTIPSFVEHFKPID